MLPAPGICGMLRLTSSLNPRPPAADRKMYVAPTPFALAEDIAHQRTLILPIGHPVDGELVEVSTLRRREVKKIVAALQL